MNKRLNLSSEKSTIITKIPLLVRALTDSNISIGIRSVDSNWYYERLSPVNVQGFNPFHLKIYINKISSISEWISSGCSDKAFNNEGDFLIREALFLVHDYLHCWATLFIQNAFPDLHFGSSKITPKNFEDMVFCHIVTEACATVGLDYWFLSPIEKLDHFFGINTLLRQLTVAYSDSDKNEFQKFNKRFDAQTPDMFGLVANFYCDGEFPGFSADDLKRSPKLYAWMKHELEYGSKQRQYTREWFLHLSDGAVKVKPSELKATIKVNKPWQRALIHEMGQKLWQLVKENRSVQFTKNRQTSVWKANPDCLDFRFVNLNTFKNKKILDIVNEPFFDRNFQYFFSQYVSNFIFDTFSNELHALLDHVKRERDMRSLFTLFKISAAKAIKSHREPVDLFFIN